jgi:hypothetical protein
MELGQEYNDLLKNSVPLKQQHKITHWQLE